MREIEIISGLYGYRPAGAKSVDVLKAGERVTVSDEEAVRLVGLKVARLVEDESIFNPPAPVATPVEGVDEGDQGDTPPDDGKGAEGVETPDGSDPHEEDEDEITLDIVDGHFTVESLMQMTRVAMEAMAADLGVDVSKCKNKTEIAELIAAVEVAADEDEDEGDGETPPDLGAAPPVV